MPKKKLSLVPLPEDAAKEFIQLKATAAIAEKRLKELNGFLKPLLEKQDKRTAIFAGWEFALTDKEREFFKLKEAKENIDEKILDPYITVSSWTEIRTTYRGEEKKAA